MGKINVAHVAEKRGQLRDAIQNVITREAIDKYGITIVDFQLTNLEYTKTFKAAVEAAAAAKATVETREQERLQAEKTAERQRIEAKGKADAYLFEREAEAKGIKLKGEAEAAAIKAQADALAANQQLVELRKAERWDGQLPKQIYAGAPIPFMDVLKNK
jgi:regulator of protease activity HflC (stomatin/prohibitin superfamily)